TCAYGGNGAYGWLTLPSVREMIDIYESAIRPLRESRVIGVALNTADLTEFDARMVIERTRGETGLPTTDPVRYPAAPLAEAIREAARAKRSLLTSSASE